MLTKDKEVTQSGKSLMVNRVADVLEVLKKGTCFYQFLSQNEINKDLQYALIVMCRARQGAVSELNPFLYAQQKQPESGEHVAALLSATYQELVGNKNICQGAAFLPLLLELEEKTLEVIDQAIQVKHPQLCRQYLQRVRVSMQSCYDAFKLINKLTD